MNLEENEKEPVRPKRTFDDPEIRKKAQERSLATRRGGEDPENGLIDFAASSVLPEKFVPTKSMLMVMKNALDPEVGPTRAAWFDAAGITRNNWYQWLKLPGFLTWWNTALEKGMAQFQSFWLLIGMKKMGQDHKYWEAMGDRFFNFAKKTKTEVETSDVEKALTEELLIHFRNMNKKESEKSIDIPSTEVPGETVLTEEEIKKMNEER